MAKTAKPVEAVRNCNDEKFLTEAIVRLSRPAPVRDRLPGTYACCPAG